MTGQLQIILNATAIALNNERRFVYPPVGDTFYFLEKDEDRNFVVAADFKNDWTISFDDERGHYVLETIASRKAELPAAFGQDSYFGVAGKVFKVHEIFATTSQTDLEQPFVSPNLRPTILFYCAVTGKTY